MPDQQPDIPDMKLLHLDPATLVVGANVRLDPRLDAEFVDSVRERGVLVPIVGYRDGDQVVVEQGQRRALAAAGVGRPTVPVVVCAARPGDADRIVDQLAENIHRTGLRDLEHVEAFRQLELLGVPAGEIARRTATPAPRVAAALTVAASPVAVQTAAEHERLTLDHAAAVAEFADDPDVVAGLVEAVERGWSFEHTVQRARNDRDERRAVAAKVAELRQAGATVLEHKPRYSDRKIQPLEQLTDDKGKKITPGRHRKCPGAAVYVDVAHGGYTNGQAVKTRVVHVCTDWSRHGHKHTSAWMFGGPGKVKLADLSPAEQDKARAERREVIESNKAWKSATEVRRRWLTQFAARKTPPKGAGRFLAAALTRGRDRLAAALTGGCPIAHDMFGVDRPSWGFSEQLKAVADNAGDARAQVIAVAMVLAAYEDQLPDNAWRAGPDTQPDHGRYLGFLESCGYELAPIEQRACGRNAPPADEEAS